MRNYTRSPIAVPGYAPRREELVLQALGDTIQSSMAVLHTDGFLRFKFLISPLHGSIVRVRLVTVAFLL